MKSLLQTLIGFLLFTQVISTTCSSFNPIIFSDNAGLIGPELNFTVTPSGELITARGYVIANPAVPTDITVLSYTDCESGLGLTDDVGQSNEIDRFHFIQLDFTKVVSVYGSLPALIEISSIQIGEGFEMYGSNTQGTLGERFYSSYYSGRCKEVVFAPLSDNSVSSTHSGYKYISVRANGTEYYSNVIISSVQLQCTIGCEPLAFNEINRDANTPIGLNYTFTNSLNSSDIPFYLSARGYKYDSQPNLPGIPDAMFNKNDDLYECERGIGMVNDNQDVNEIDNEHFVQLDLTQIKSLANTLSSYGYNFHFESMFISLKSFDNFEGYSITSASVEAGTLNTQGLSLTGLANGKNTSCTGNATVFNPLQYNYVNIAYKSSSEGSFLTSGVFFTCPTKPSFAPTSRPLRSNTYKPVTRKPAFSPSVNPSVKPSATPSIKPSVNPSTIPTITPSFSPTITPSYIPTITPSKRPTVTPTVVPTTIPTVTPSAGPTVTPSFMPSVSPSTQAPSKVLARDCVGNFTTLQYDTPFQGLELTLTITEQFTNPITNTVSLQKSNIIARGYEITSAIPTPSEMVVSGFPGDLCETGLGMVLDVGEANEIDKFHFIQLDFTNAVTRYGSLVAYINIRSIDTNEGFSMYGSNVQGELGELYYSNNFTGSCSETAFAPLAVNSLQSFQGYRYISVRASGSSPLANVLIGFVELSCGLGCYPLSYNFGNNITGLVSNTDIGSSHLFSAPTQNSFVFPLTGRGFLIFNTNDTAPSNMFYKQDHSEPAACESGLGMVDDLALVNEIDTQHFIQLDLRQIKTLTALLNRYGYTQASNSLLISFASMTVIPGVGAEGYAISGTNTVGNMGKLLINRTATTNANCSTDVSIQNPFNYDFINVFGTMHTLPDMYGHPGSILLNSATLKCQGTSFDIIPSAKPSVKPTKSPRFSKRFTPTHKPTTLSTLSPNFKPDITSNPTSVSPISPRPTNTPTIHHPTNTPTTGAPTFMPSKSVSFQPLLKPTASPTFAPNAAQAKDPDISLSPTVSSAPTSVPTGQPSGKPSSKPNIQIDISIEPSVQPSTTTEKLTSNPTHTPTYSPTSEPTINPTSAPTSNAFIYIADQFNNRIQKWTEGATEGVTIAGGIDQGSASNQFKSPFGLFVDAAASIYIADTDNNRIQKWTSGATEGITVVGNSSGVSGSSSSELNSPNGVFVDSASSIYVADTFNNRIQKWLVGNTEATTVAGDSGGVAGSGTNELNGPFGVFVDSADNLYICDAFNHRIQKWLSGTNDGTTVAGNSGGNPGAGLNELDNPLGFFVDTSDNVYVADFGNHRVVMWTPGAAEGVVVAGGNGNGNHTNQLRFPTGVFVDSTGNIYVTDQSNFRVMKWAPGASEGTIVAGDQTAGENPNQLYYPSSSWVGAGVPQPQSVNVNSNSANATHLNNSVIMVISVTVVVSLIVCFVLGVLFFKYSRRSDGSKATKMLELSDLYLESNANLYGNTDDARLHNIDSHNIEFHTMDGLDALNHSYNVERKQSFSTISNFSSVMTDDESYNATISNPLAYERRRSVSSRSVYSENTESIRNYSNVNSVPSTKITNLSKIVKEQRL